MGDQTQQTATVHRVVLQCLLWSMILLANSAHPVAGQSMPVPSDATTPTPLGSILAFESGVWAKVAERTCIRCHHLQGEAKDSDFLLESSIDGLYDPETLARNQNAMRSVAKKTSGEQSILLQKVVGGLEHGGGQILKPDSTGFRILESFIAQTLLPTNEPKSNPAIDSYEQAPFFDGITMLSESRLLRRITLSLVGRLPTPEESKAVQQDGLAALHPILDSILREDAFYVRLKEGFNDIFLTIGIEDNAETLLSYDHFEKTRLWYQTHDFSHLPESQRERAGWKLAAVYRDALLREPLELIEYIVRNEKPISELATADYIMVSPYTARGYGIFDEIKDQFRRPIRIHPRPLARSEGSRRKGPRIDDGLVSARRLPEYVPLSSAVSFDRDQPQSLASKDVLSAFLGHRHHAACTPFFGRRRSCRQIRDTNDASGSLCRLPQDHRSGRRNFSGL